MHEHDGPFLSSAAIRRVLTLHPFSEPNRIYLLQEAERRERWERSVETLLREILIVPGEVTPDPAHPCEVAGADVTPLHP